MAIAVTTADMKRAVRYFEKNNFLDLMIIEDATSILIRPIADPSISVVVRPKDSSAQDKVELTERKPLGNPG